MLTRTLARKNYCSNYTIRSFCKPADDGINFEKSFKWRSKKRNLVVISYSLKIMLMRFKRKFVFNPLPTIVSYTYVLGRSVIPLRTYIYVTGWQRVLINYFG